MIVASGKDEQSSAEGEEGNVTSLQETVDEILENPDRTDKLILGKEGSLESTPRKTVEGTEQAWNKTVKIPGDTGEDKNRTPSLLG